MARVKYDTTLRQFELYYNGMLVIQSVSLNYILRMYNAIA